MDIEFSQVGQQIAVVPVAGVNKAADQEQTAAHQFSSEKEKDNTKVEPESVDKQQEEQVSDQQLESAVRDISEFVQSQSRALSFSIDESSNRSIVKVTDSSSGEVIRQIPTQEALELAERIQTLQSDIGTAVGVLLNRTV